MNADQVAMAIRWLLSVGGPIGAFLVSHGMKSEDVTALGAALVGLVGALPPVISFIWGWYKHSIEGRLQTAKNIPGVKKIVVGPEAPSPVTAAALDPSDPKVQFSGS
jgi:hypothetical protein